MIKHKWTTRGDLCCQSSMKSFSWKVSHNKSHKYSNIAPTLYFIFLEKNFCSPLAYYSLKTLFEKVFYAWSLRARFSRWKFHRPQRLDVSGLFGNKRWKSRCSNVWRFENLILSCFAARNWLFHRSKYKTSPEKCPRFTRRRKCAHLAENLPLANHPC